MCELLIVDNSIRRKGLGLDCGIHFPLLMILFGCHVMGYSVGR